MTEDTLETMLRLDRLADLARPLAISASATRNDHSQRADVPHARLTRALQTYGLLSRKGTTEVGELLTDQHPLGLRDSYRLFPADIRAWAHFVDTLRHGSGVFERVNGALLWQYLEEHPSQNAVFDRAMAAMTRLELEGLRPAYSWSDLGDALDLGGGNGALLTGLPFARTARLAVLDAPPVVRRGKAVDSQERLEWIEGDFHRAVPAGWSVYLMKRILYSYDDAKALHILAKTVAAMDADSRVLIVEPVLRANDKSPYARLLDLEMLMLGAGRVRSRQQLRALFDAVGLRLRRIVPTPLVSVIDARLS